MGSFWSRIVSVAGVGSAARALSTTLLIGCMFFVGAGVALAQEMTAAEAEDFARVRWFEGMPEEEAQRIGREGAARLIALLEDPSETDVHANALLALGLCGEPGALAAIAAWADLSRAGEVDRGTFRAWQALPFALAHAARTDRRAIAQLEAELSRVPDFHFRHHTAQRLRNLGRRGVVNALSRSTLPEASAALQRARGRATDPAFRAHIDEAVAPRRSSTSEVGR